MEDELYYKNFLWYSRFSIQRVLVPLLMATGVIGNAITIVIMTRRRMRSSTNIYLAALAIFDMFYLIFTFVLSLSHYPRIPDPDNQAYWYLKPYFMMLTDTCSNTSVWLTVTFTAERYIAVCHPMKGKVFCTESRAKKAIVAVFLFCFAFALPTPFEWIVVEGIDADTKSDKLTLDHSEMGRDDTYRTVYYWLTVVFFIFVPFLLLSIFNSFLIRAVHLSKKQRSSMTRGGNDSSQENKITIMLIAVVILFFFCQTPTACYLLYVSFKKNFTANDMYLLPGLGNIFNLLMALNSAGNFVLFCLLSQKYRRIFVQIFCSCLKEKRNNMNSTYCQSTVVGDENTESSESNPNYRMCSTRKNQDNSPKGSSFDVSQQTRGNPGENNQSSFLADPKASAKVADYEDDLNGLNENTKRGSGTCGQLSKVMHSPLRSLRNTVGVGKEMKEQVIPLKEDDSKCTAATTAQVMPAASCLSANSSV